jgi:hypothetical protein
MVADASTAPRMPEPTLNYTRSMVDPPGEWRLLGDYAVWTGNRKSPATPHLLHELIEKKILPIPISSARAIIHAIKGGTWFHVQDLFGFWMRADVDTVWIDAPGEDGHYYSLILGGSGGKPGGLSSAWVCPSCGTLYNQHDVDVSRGRLKEFFDDTAKQVALFNSSNTKRACPSCSAEHPVTYGFLDHSTADK